MTAAEKREAIRLVEESDLPARRTLREIQISRATFYRWYRRYRAEGLDGLRSRPSAARRYWNRIPAPIRQRVVGLALAARNARLGNSRGKSRIARAISSRNRVCIGF